MVSGHHGERAVSHCHPSGHQPGTNRVRRGQGGETVWLETRVVEVLTEVPSDSGSEPPFLKTRPGHFGLASGCHFHRALGQPPVDLAPWTQAPKKGTGARGLCPHVPPSRQRLAGRPGPLRRRGPLGTPGTWAPPCDAMGRCLPKSRPDSPGAPRLAVLTQTASRRGQPPAGLGLTCSEVAYAP